ncbi:MAG: heparinase II/III family protein [Rhodospirillales bacterium]|nr:heparinase II/III family protein [Rhodospirillales bacterium]
MGASDGRTSAVFLGALRWFRGRTSESRRRGATHRLVHRSIDPVPGVAGRGDALVAGLYDFGGQAVRADEVGERGETPWRYREAGDYWLAELHGFDWLRDLRAAGTGLAAERGRSIVLDWLRQHRSIDSTTAWTPEVIGRRLSAWLAHGEFLLQGADDEFTQRFHQALDLQARHLTRTARNADEGLPQLIAYRGLIESGLCLPDGERRVTQGLKLLEAALAEQVLGDGGYVERNPSTHLAAIWSLAGLRATLDASERPAGQTLSETIARLAPMLRTFRHGDGGFALFNGGVEEERGPIDLALSRSAASGGGGALDAPYTGFRRVEGRHATLIADTGAPPVAGRWAHAGTLSFEMSAGRERLIVNCGGWRGGNAGWREALRGTAAHSTLVVDDTNTATLGEDGEISDGPTTVKVERRDQDGATWIDSSHDGYLDTLGLIHKRRLYVGREGADVRGEDTLTHIRRRRQRGREFALRFHLHPEVTCAMTEDRRAVLLRLASGAIWQMRAAGASMSIDESVYAGDGVTRRRTSQIALTGPIEDATTVKWAIKLLPKGN